MATEYKSPLGLLDYIVPDRLEQQAISAFSRPLREGETAPDYGNFTPNIDPNNPQGLSNIETLLGYAYMPQMMPTPTNKQMIDAAILRAGLEMGKGRQPGETFGGALARGAEAMSIPAKTLAEAQAALAKVKGKTPSQVSMTEEKALGFESAVKGLYDISPEVKTAVDLLGGKGAFSDPGIDSLAAEAMSIQSADPTLSVTDAIKKAAEKIDKYTDIE
tara:strand:- start:7464 stop:8117 length:654 start_codon:yes stop_codon:yes gene_type:complete